MFKKFRTEIIYRYFLIRYWISHRNDPLIEVDLNELEKNLCSLDFDFAKAEAHLKKIGKWESPI